MTSQLLINHSNEHRVVSLLLNRPSTRNAISSNLAAELVSWLEWAEYDDNSVAVVLGSAVTGVFSSGADFGELADADVSTDLIQSGTPAIASVCQAIRSCNKPVVAFADGVVIGGALALFLAADLRYCSPRATFRIPVAKLHAVFPVTDTWALLRSVGAAATADLLLTGASVDHEVALRTGLVSRVVEDAEAVSSVVAEMSESSGAALRANLAMVRRLRDAEPPTVGEDVLEMCRSVYDSAERRAALEARLNKRSLS